MILLNMISNLNAILDDIRERYALDDKKDLIRQSTLVRTYFL